jgi:serine-type D-Ala-D-Ala carboxypeptidase/endopeptidase (penicillin-binding protein 4)
MQWMKAFLCFILSICSSFGLLNAQTISYQANIQKAIQTLQNDTSIRHASWGFCLKSLKTGNIIASYNAEKMLTPASTFKLITTSTALAVLGPDYTFTTRLAYRGSIKDSILNGDIMILGGGDPTLGAGRLKGVIPANALIDQWVMSIKKAGIKSIHGTVIADDTHFETAMQPATWAWDDIGNFYGAGPSGLNFIENQFTIRLQPGKNMGDPVNLLGTTPTMNNIEFHNELKTAAPYSGDNGYVFGAPYSNTRYLRGTIPLTDSFSIKAAMPNPAQYCALLLAKALHIAIPTYSLNEKDQNINTSTLTLIHTVQSPPLKQIVYTTNKESHNLFAETLLKEMGYQLQGKGSTSAGLHVVDSFWRSKGIDMENVYLQDGSGLSRYDAVSPLFYVNMLSIIAKSGYFNEFYASLPYYGSSKYGVYKKDCKVPLLIAKSGYMTHVRSYAGYVTNSAGENFTFAFIINNAPERNGALSITIGKFLMQLGL